MKPCRECKKPVSETAASCPRCGADAPALSAFANQLATGLFIGFVAFVVMVTVLFLCAWFR